MGKLNRTQEIRQVLIFVLVLNWLIALAKVMVGYWTDVNSMLADGFHSFSDGSSNIIGLIGIWVAAKPKDREHLYGHKKYETFASVGIAILLILVCNNILHGSIERFFNLVTPDVNIYSFGIMLITIIVNVGVATYEYRKGKQTNSDILISDSMHTGADILTSFSVILALVAVKLGYPIVDPIGSVFIALFIAYAAFRILRESCRVLCDTVILDIKEIKKVVKEVKGVIDCHKIRSRGRIDDIHIDLHVLLKKDMHIDEAHNISYEIESEIKKKFPGVTDVLVHLEPLIHLKKR
jgi:cation diffusion facilitator family transporter